REMEAAWLLIRRGGLEGSEASKAVFEMAVGKGLSDTNIWDLLPGWTRWWESGWPALGDTGHLFVMKRPGGSLWEKDPFSYMVRFSDRSAVMYTPDISL
ncbi:MAG: hypothetical protein ACMUFK_02190, partial [Thermoplasmatota archaeon]